MVLSDRASSAPLEDREVFCPGTPSLRAHIAVGSCQGRQATCAEKQGLNDTHQHCGSLGLRNMRSWGWGGGAPYAGMISFIDSIVATDALDPEIASPAACPCA